MMKNVQMIDESSVELEDAACEICGSKNFEHYLVSHGMRDGCSKPYNLVRCAHCELVYLNPRPTRQSMMRYYRESDPEKEGRPPAFYERFYYSVFRRIPSRRKGRMLDVGCGAGRYIYTLKEDGWDAEGVDIAYTDYAKKELGLKIYEGGLQDAKFPDRHFDVITFWWSLEHMYEPLLVLREANRILKDDGLVIIGVHNIDSPEAKLFREYWFHLFLPKHLYHFSPSTLGAMLDRAGFGRVRTRFDMFSFGVIGSLQSLLNAKKVSISVNNPAMYAMSLPLDLIMGLFRAGGLMTAYAYKS